MKDETCIVPMWISKRITQLKRDGKIPSLHFHAGTKYSMYSIISHFQMGSFIDHWGRCGDVFYCEPYMTVAQASEKANWLAGLLDCEWRFAESVWNPPHTVRVEFFSSDNLSPSR